MKIYRPSRKAEEVKFADRLRIELIQLRLMGYEKIKIETLVVAEARKYIGCNYDIAKTEILKALDRLGIDHDDRFVYLNPWGNEGVRQ